MLALRLVSAAILIPVLIGACIAGGIWTTIVVCVFAYLATRELLVIAKRGGFDPFVRIGSMLSIGFVLAADLKLNFGVDLTLGYIAFAVMGLIVFRMVRRGGVDTFADWAVTLTAAIYIGGLLSFWVLIRGLPNMGLQWGVFALLMTFASDSSAYFVGRAIGRHPLAPKTSPKKSIEGALGSLIFTALAGMLANPLLGLPVEPIVGLGLGFLISLAAQAGDLAESALKRAGQVKDASDAIPGHGGVLDRTDSLTFVAVVVYYAALWLPV